MHGGHICKKVARTQPTERERDFSRCHVTSILQGWERAVPISGARPQALCHTPPRPTAKALLWRCVMFILVFIDFLTT